MLNEKYIVFLDNGCEMDVDYMLHDEQSEKRASYFLDEIVEAAKYRIAYECNNQVAAEKFHICQTRVSEAFNLYYCHKDIVKTIIDECIAHGKVEYLKFRKHKILAVWKGNLVYNAKCNVNLERKPTKLEQMLDWAIDNYHNNQTTVDIFEDDIVGEYFNIVDMSKEQYITVNSVVIDDKEILMITVELPTEEWFEVVNYKEYKSVKPAQKFITKVMEG